MAQIRLDYISGSVMIGQEEGGKEVVGAEDVNNTRRRRSC